MALKLGLNVCLLAEECFETESGNSRRQSFLGTLAWSLVSPIQRPPRAGSMVTGVYSTCQQIVVDSR